MTSDNLPPMYLKITSLSGKDCLLPVRFDLQHEVLADITGQFFDHMQDAISQGDFVTAIKLMCRCERIMHPYIEAEFFMLEDVQAILSEALDRAHQMLRRALIKKVFTCPQEDVPELIKLLEAQAGCLYDSDFIAVESALAEGRSIFGPSRALEPRHAST